MVDEGQEGVGANKSGGKLLIPLGHAAGCGVQVGCMASCARGSRHCLSAPPLFMKSKL